MDLDALSNIPELLDLQTMRTFALVCINFRDACRRSNRYANLLQLYAITTKLFTAIKTCKYRCGARLHFHFIQNTQVRELVIYIEHNHYSVARFFRTCSYITKTIITNKHPACFINTLFNTVSYDALQSISFNFSETSPNSVGHIDHVYDKNHKVYLFITKKHVPSTLISDRDLLKEFTKAILLVYRDKISF